MNVFVFDIETIPDVESGRKLLSLNNLPDDEVANAMFAMRRQETGNDFLPHYLQRIVAISVILNVDDRIKVWSLGDPHASEAEIIERFFSGLEKYTPNMISWNGSGFDLPVLHYRALLHGISAPRYWEVGNDDNNFRYNNYLNRYHYRHMDLMDILAGYQSRANAPLNAIATMLGLPGKMGMHGSLVWPHFQKGDLESIRNYCETDVLNTYLVYLRFELMRGLLNQQEYERQCQLLKNTLLEEQKSHLTAFVQHWNESNRNE